MKSRSVFRTILHWMGTIAIGALVGVAFVIISAAASVGLRDAKADTNDDGYVMAMRVILNNSSADYQTVVSGGHAICTAIALHGEDWTATYLETPPNPMPMATAWMSIGASESAYCPGLDEDKVSA